MRFETAGSIGKFAVLVVLALSLRPWEASKVRNGEPVRCEDEKRVLAHWTKLKLIRQSKQGDRNVDLFVDDSAWNALPSSTRIEIGQAAYCSVAVAGKGGIARIDDSGSRELARVTHGEWLAQPARQ
jgi:hypothetical protein